MTAPPSPLHRLHIHVAGPWPFITFRSYTLAGRHFIWRARDHRKGLERWARGLEHLPVPLWQTRGYNWLTGLAFAIGALLFMAGALLSLVPPHALPVPSRDVGRLFFLGSLPFTFAAYLQLFQAANASVFSVKPQDAPHQRVMVIGWQLHSAGWLSTFAQFLGTLAFNLNTWNALHTANTWRAQDIWVWTPDMVGSLLFLISGYLAYLEVSGGYWSWKPAALSWQIVSVNLMGCIAFMTGAVLSFSPERPEASWIGVVGNTHLFAGSLCFFVGALLTMREARTAASA